MSQEVSDYLEGLDKCLSGVISSNVTSDQFDHYLSLGSAFLKISSVALLKEIGVSSRNIMLWSLGDEIPKYYIPSILRGIRNKVADCARPYSSYRQALTRLSYHIRESPRVPEKPDFDFPKQYSDVERSQFDWLKDELEFILSLCELRADRGFIDLEYDMVLRRSFLSSPADLQVYVTHCKEIVRSVLFDQWGFTGTVEISSKFSRSLEIVMSWE